MTVPLDQNTADPNASMVLLGRVSAAQIFPLKSTLHSDRLPVLRDDADAPDQYITTILALNAALIRRNCELEAKLTKQLEKAVASPGLRADFGGNIKPSDIRTTLGLVSNQTQEAPDKLHMSTALQGIAGLTSRQVQVLHLVLAGQPNKNIAVDLGISQRTVESHRAAIMCRSGAKSLPALVRMAVGKASGADFHGCQTPDPLPDHRP